jgi:hypothetical protein
LPSARAIVESDRTDASKIASEALRFAIFNERLLTVEGVRNADARRRVSYSHFSDHYFHIEATLSIDFSPLRLPRRHNLLSSS